MKQQPFKKLLEQCGSGPIQFSGTSDALYERHLIFDHVIDPKKADARDQFEAVARSLRDIVSQRWLQTEQTYEAKNPKRVFVWHP
jgi:starch phosphorylase